MGLKADKKYTAAAILKEIDEAQIWEAYFGNFQLRVPYSSVFREDKNPSTGFYISSSGKIIYNDIVTSEKLDCFAFVAKLHKLSYRGALDKVVEDFGLLDGNRKIDILHLKKQQLIEEQPTEEKKIDVIADKWMGDYVKYWDQFYITENELVREDVYPIRKLFINGKLIPNYSNDLRFAYVIKIKDKFYKKIYSPYAENYKWINNIPIYIPFGINKLPKKSNTLMVTKSAKDRLILLKYFTDVIALQNESPAAMNQKTLNYLNNNYLIKYINTDNDSAGRKAALHYQQLGFEPILTPDECRKTVKDPAEFVAKYGLKRFEDFLKYKKLI